MFSKKSKKKTPKITESMVDKLLIAERNRTKAEKEARRKAMEARENAHKAELLRKYRFRQMMAKGEVAKFMKTRRLPKKS